MAELDWDFLTSSAATAAIDRGPTAGSSKPTGGGNHTFGFRSLVNDAGAVGLHQNQANFAPTTKGGRMSGALVRSSDSGGEDLFSIFMACMVQGVDVGGDGYYFGLAADAPANIVLRKGKMNEGLPNNAAGNPAQDGTLLRSTKTVALGEWIHLRLDVKVEGTGDVILKCFENTDLDGGGVTAPVWAPIVGMESFIDDAIGANSGTVPHTAGRHGYAFQSNASLRIGYVDYYKFSRQL